MRRGRKAAGGGLYGGSWDSRSCMKVSLSTKNSSKHVIKGTNWKLELIWSYRRVSSNSLGSLFGISHHVRVTNGQSPLCPVLMIGY